MIIASATVALAVNKNRRSKWQKKKKKKLF